MVRPKPIMVRPKPIMVQTEANYGQTEANYGSTEANYGQTEADYRRFFELKFPPKDTFRAKNEDIHPFYNPNESIPNLNSTSFSGSE